MTQHLNSGGKKPHSKNRPAKKPQLDAVRFAAFKTLKAVFQGKQTLEAAFTKHKNTLDGRDVAFAYTLAAGVLRTALYLDHCTAAYLKKPFERTSPQNIILRMGVYQLLFMDGVKDHAAIATTVDLAKTQKLHHVAGVINAVLRNLQRNDTPTFNPQLCLPKWFEKELQRDYSESALPKLCESMLQQAAVDVRTYSAPQPEGSVELSGLKNAYRLPEGTFASNVEGLNTGGLYIQDMAAQWPATILANTVKLKGPVVDMCAAPGGKTLQLLDLLPNTIIAADLNPKRLKKLAQNMAHMPKQPVTIACDGLKPAIAPNSLSGLLLDAPCTATGTSRRHPEVLHLRQPADLDYLASLQRQMLQKAAELLAPEGVLVYAVCSLFHKEGEAQNLWALENLPLKPRAFDVPAELAAAQAQPHTLRLSPELNCDGFYIACYEKQP